MRFAIAILLCIAAIFALSACGEASTKTVNYPGNWESSDGKFAAEIAEDHISVWILNDDERSIYWDGSWSPKGDEAVSKANHEVLDTALLASQSEEKVFKLKNEKITFEFSMMGSTKKVELIR